MNKDQVVNEIKALAAKYFSEYNFKTKYKVPLMSRSYNEEEIAEVVDTLLTPEKVTLNASGELKTEKFENLWANFIGVKNGVMVNSGSSANLVAIYALTNPTINNRLIVGDEVILPALNWSTCVSPLYAAGLKPVFVDVNSNEYGVDVNQVRDAIGPKTKAIMAVHLLGFPVDMDSIMTIAKENNLFVIEDCCEAHGAEYKGSKVGSFGDISTFSFYLSHHITTIEGGMIMSNNDNLSDLIRIIRSQGVMRNVKNIDYKNKINSKYPDIDSRFLFVNTGYNFRPTEMEGAFGLVQFNRFESYFKLREKNAEFFTRKLNKFSEFIQLPIITDNSRPAWFAYPIMLKENSPFTAKELVSFLEEKGIETRPIMSGDYTRHPVANIYDNRIFGDLKNTKFIHDNAFFIGVHPGLRDEEKNYTISCFEEFFEKF